MNLPGFFEIVELFLGVGVGLSMLILLIRLSWPSSYGDPELIDENCRERRVVHKDEAGACIDIVTAYEKELKELRRLREELHHKTKKLLEGIKNNP